MFADLGFTDAAARQAKQRLAYALNQVLEERKLSQGGECVRLGGTTLAEQWGHADTVLYVRLSASESPTTPVGYYRHVATVIDALKKPAAPLKAPVFVLQNQRSAAPGPYDINQELVVFLKAWRSSEFMITNDEPGLAIPTGSSDLAIAFLIQYGHIQRAPSNFSRATSECRLMRFLTSCALLRAAISNSVTGDNATDWQNDRHHAAPLHSCKYRRLHAPATKTLSD